MAPGQRTAFPFPVPMVSAIIERQRGPITEVLVQVRWKPQQDPLYSGTFEIPAGGIELYESVYDALSRQAHGGARKKLFPTVRHLCDNRTRVTPRSQASPVSPALIRRRADPWPTTSPTCV